MSNAWKLIKEKITKEPERAGRTAIIDCAREYSYAQIFEEWDAYARVFSALGMTGENNARVGIAGTISAEPLFAFYGLNMTGTTVSMLSYPDFLPSGQWKSMVKHEKLTDLILSDFMLSPETWPEIEAAKEELGLRNIILLHSRLGGPCTGPAELFYNEFNYRMLKRTAGTVFMDDLLEEYAGEEIKYGSDDPGRIAIITHTSGTTKGVRKPLPYTEKTMEIIGKSFGVGVISLAAKSSGSAQLRMTPSFDFSSFLCMGGIVNGMLYSGNTLVLTFFGFMHPKFIRAVDYYELNVLQTSGFMLDSWLRRGDIDDVDFSSLHILATGGSYLSREKVARYLEFARGHGFKGSLSMGYGMSETGGQQILTPQDSDDDVIGFPRPEENYRIQDETDGLFYKMDEGERTGILYVTSDTMCVNELDGEKLFDLTEIDGRSFICSNDLVRLNKDGSLSYAGRADKFFVNNDGVRFESGLVDAEMSKQEGIHMCAVVPVLDKRIHDTVPVLYVVPEAKGKAAAEGVRKALEKIYIEGRLIDKTSLPVQFVLVDSIPCNSNGKIDIYRITRERLEGEAYNIVPVHDGDRLTGIDMEFTDHLSSIKGGALPEGMEGRSALGLYELLNTGRDGNDSFNAAGPFGAVKKIRTVLKQRRHFNMFDFFNGQQNPFMFNPFASMMGMSGETEGEEEEYGASEPMQFMQQMFMMQMQMMQMTQNMMMMPLQMMKSMAEKQGLANNDTGFKLGNMSIPPELLKKLMKMDMSPENLEKLQRVLDFVFETMPEPEEK